jgi:hypothetical protein
MRIVEGLLQIMMDFKSRILVGCLTTQMLLKFCQTLEEMTNQEEGRSFVSTTHLDGQTFGIL